MGGINPSALYGAVRGLDDAREIAQKTEAFNTDQAIRRMNLENAQNTQAEAPLRRRALEAQLSDTEAAAKYNAEIRPLQLEQTRLTQKKGKLELDDYMAAVTKKNKLAESLRTFNASGNPQDVLNALSEIYPQMQGATATKGTDGSITITRKDGSQQVLPAKITNSIGQEVSAADQLAFLAMNQLDPVKDYQERRAADLKMRGEMAKKDADLERAESVAETRAAATAKASAATTTAREERERTRRRDAGSRLAANGVRGALKTVGIPGGFVMQYGDSDDAALVPSMETLASKHFQENFDAAGMTEAAARQYAIETVRSSFVNAKKAATAAATKLVAAGINPQDKDALRAALQAKNPDAAALVQAMQKLETELGSESAVRHLLSQLPKPKKK
mgnify:CR=1 FL=1